MINYSILKGPSRRRQTLQLRCNRCRKKTSQRSAPKWPFFASRRPLHQWVHAALRSGWDQRAACLSLIKQLLGPGQLLPRLGETPSCWNFRHCSSSAIVSKARDHVQDVRPEQADLRSKLGQVLSGCLGLSGLGFRVQG